MRVELSSRVSGWASRSLAFLMVSILAIVVRVLSSGHPVCISIHADARTQALSRTSRFNSPWNHLERSPSEPNVRIPAFVSASCGYLQG